MPTKNPLDVLTFPYTITLRGVEHGLDVKITRRGKDELMAKRSAGATIDDLGFTFSLTLAEVNAVIEASTIEVAVRSESWLRGPRRCWADRVKHPFSNVIAKDRVDDWLVEGLCGPLWRFALTSLYLSSGAYLPDDAKKHGAMFGFCDDQGRQQPRADATHFGWSARTK